MAASWRRDMLIKTHHHREWQRMLSKGSTHSLCSRTVTLGARGWCCCVIGDTADSCMPCFQQVLNCLNCMSATQPAVLRAKCRAAACPLQRQHQLTPVPALLLLCLEAERGELGARRHAVEQQAHVVAMYCLVLGGAVQLCQHHLLYLHACVEGGSRAARGALLESGQARSSACQAT